MLKIHLKFRNENALSLWNLRTHHILIGFNEFLYSKLAALLFIVLQWIVTLTFVLLDLEKVTFTPSSEKFKTKGKKPINTVDLIIYANWKLTLIATGWFEVEQYSHWIICFSNLSSGLICGNPWDIWDNFVNDLSVVGQTDDRSACWSN